VTKDYEGFGLRPQKSIPLGIPPERGTLYGTAAQWQIQKKNKKKNTHIKPCENVYQVLIGCPIN